MATAAMLKEEKLSRMDLRLTNSQRASYETAAGLKGQTLTQWSLEHLDEAARRDIEQAAVTRLSAESFEELRRALAEPMPKAAEELLAREESWA